MTTEKEPLLSQELLDSVWPEGIGSPGPALAPPAPTTAQEIAAAVRAGRTVRLPSDHPLFKATRSYPKAWRERVFGAEAVAAAERAE